uniref:RRM domain-containing protein n=1 Tax=Meloidogyne incognita TaxID=6306 RepID=A0A914KJW8_MELIC
MQNKVSGRPKKEENKIAYPSQNKNFNKNFKRNGKQSILDDLSEQDMDSDDSFGDSDEFDEGVGSSDEEFEDEEEEGEEGEGSGEDEENEGMSKIKEEEGEEENVDEDDKEDELEDGEDDLEGEEDELEDEDDVSEKDSSKGEVIKLTGIKNGDQLSEGDEMESDNASEEDEENETKKASRRENVKMRRASIKASESRTVFVGNAPVKTQNRELRKLFKTFGEIEAVYQRTHLQMTEKLTKMMVSKYPEISDRLTSTNFYIRYVKDEQAENAARAMNGTKLNGHVLRVTVGAKKEVDHRRSIFVGNIPHTTLDESVRAYFSTCGKISALRLLRDKQTGLVRGSGFIEFVDSDSIQKALELNNLPFEGRKLRISKVYKKNKLEKITIKNEKKRENLKRKLPKVPKGAENFMVLKRGRFEGNGNVNRNQNKNKFKEENKLNNKVIKEENVENEKKFSNNKFVDNKIKKGKKLFVNKQKSGGLKGNKKRKSLII